MDDDMKFEKDTREKNILQAPRGMRDILPSESVALSKVRDTCREVARIFDYREIVTPIVEDIGVFARTVGDDSDLVQKEMYTFDDRGGEQLALRPENTAGVCRAYIEHGMKSLPQPVRLWYFGSFFRYDRPQAGRYRQLTQFGIEAIGSEDPSLDAEVISLQSKLYKSLGLNDIRLGINSIGTQSSRSNFLLALGGYLRKFEAELSEDSQRRLKTNPMRIIDSKDLTDQEIIKDAPKILDFLSEGDEAHFHRVTRDLDSLGISYDIDHSIVRGLDYYTHTVWEFEPIGASGQSTLGGGGRYDGLIEELGGPSTPGVGFATGIERILINLLDKGIIDQQVIPPDVFFIALGSEGHHTAVKLAMELRDHGISVKAGGGGRSMKSLMRAANNSGAFVAVVIGDEEVTEQSAAIRILRDSADSDRNLKVPQEDLVTAIRDIQSQSVVDA
ncbi:MAG: histidine--tRNA ligase [Chloroflexi bacterium]|nr:histidine--tRNA ligase [Chloroflexota bacterium]|tara:strand:- start:1538 stop:2872 length:1335 start_codon:yes stop_codon:yes gene_type:complete